MPFVNTEYPASMKQLQAASYFPSENTGTSNINVLHTDYYNFGIAFTEANEEQSLNFKTYSSVSLK